MTSSATVSYTDRAREVFRDALKTWIEDPTHIEAASAVIAEVLSEVNQDRERLKDRIDNLEAMRPHWAKGYSSDGLAAQISFGALNTLWKLLGVSDQTAAVHKLNWLIEQAPSPIKDDARPANCRNRLRDNGQMYPRSGCASCGTGALRGCPHERKAS